MDWCEDAAPTPEFMGVSEIKCKICKLALLLAKKNARPPFRRPGGSQSGGERRCYTSHQLPPAEGGCRRFIYGEGIRR